MQGGRSNIGARTVPTSARMATRLANSPQPAAVVHRPVPATPAVPSSTRPVASADHEGLIVAGQQTTGGQTVAPPNPTPQAKPGQAISPNTGAHRPSGPGTAPAEPTAGIKL